MKRPVLSLEGFLREHFLCGSPVIISDSMAHWPARIKWNDVDYLKRVAGDRTVPVEVDTLPDEPITKVLLMTMNFYFS